MTAGPTTGKEAAFIRANLRLAPVPMLPHLRLYMAHSGSRLSRLGTTPYWAYPWAGGLALACHLAAHPETVAGRRVLDLGAGSGLVGIAAVKTGAASAIAADVDPYAWAAVALNAAANGVTVDIAAAEVAAHPPPPVDLVVAGDVFYAPDVAESVGAFLGRCRASGLDVLVGDPGRAQLPLHRLRALATYGVPDFGAGRAAGTSTVFAFDAKG